MEIARAEGQLVAADAAAGLVGRDVRCVRCGYELRGLAAAGLCPECGGEIRRTLLGDLLVFADARYVRTLRIGASLALAGIVAALCTIYGGFGLLLASLAGAAWSPWGVVSLLGMGGFAFGVLSLAGWWLLSTPDPGRLGVDAGLTSRKVVRVGVVVTVAGWAGSALLGLVMSGLLGPPALTPMAGLRAMYASNILGWVGVVAQLLGASGYMAAMAARVRCAAIAKASRDVRALTIATVCAGLIAGAMFWWMRSPLVAVPGIIGYGCFAVTAGRYASVVAMARREIKLAEAVIRSEGGE